MQSANVEFVFSPQKLNQPLDVSNAKVSFTSPLGFKFMVYIVESNYENLTGVWKCVNATAFNYKNGHVGNKFL